jgi:hypothetical protein
MSLIMRSPGSSKMEDTDGKWLRVIVYDTLMGHVDAAARTPDRQRYILMMDFRLAMAGSGWVLRGIHIDE